MHFFISRRTPYLLRAPAGAYAKADIPAHSELYFSYGKNYWSHRGVVPEDPPPL